MASASATETVVLSGGVFQSRLLLESVRRAALLDPQVIGLRLYVDKDNSAAHATYQKMGLEWTAYQVMETYPLQRGRFAPGQTQ